MDFYVAPPPQEEEPSQEATQPSSSPSPAPMAVPTLSEYREKYKNRTLTAFDVRAKQSAPVPIKRLDADLDRFTYKGDALFFGEGVEQEI